MRMLASYAGTCWDHIPMPQLILLWVAMAREIANVKPLSIATPAEPDRVYIVTSYCMHNITVRMTNLITARLDRCEKIICPYFVSGIGVSAGLLKVQTSFTTFSQVWHNLQKTVIAVKLTNSAYQVASIDSP